MFKILSAPANVASQIIRTVAGDLLETRDNLLESTTRKVKKLYMEDWIHCRDTGVLRLGCGLHGFLSIVAMNLKLDSGALESLNSMIRQQTNISNNTNISLELLSSRVNMRKPITTETGGSNKLRDVKPVATKLASSCVLYHDRVTSVLNDVHRWAPPQPATGQYTNGNPTEYDPGVALTKNQNWAFKFHRALMKSLITHSKTNVLVGFTLSQEGNTPDFSATYVVAEMTKRMCQVVELTHIQDDKFVIKSPLEFVSSLDVLANTYNFVKEHKSGILWETTQYDYADRIPDWSSSDQVLQPFQANQLQVVVTGTGEVHPIKFRKEYTRKTVAPTTTEDGNMGALLDGDDSASDMSIDSIQANEEMVHLAHELRGEYSDDDDDDNAGDIEQSTDKLETPMESMESMNENRGDGLLTTDETVDFHDMQATNDRLLAAAANLQEQSAFVSLNRLMFLMVFVPMKMKLEKHYFLNTSTPKTKIRTQIQRLCMGNEPQEPVSIPCLQLRCRRCSRNGTQPCSSQPGFARKSLRDVMSSMLHTFNLVWDISFLWSCMGGMTIRLLLASLHGPLRTTSFRVDL